MLHYQPPPTNSELTSDRVWSLCSGLWADTAGGHQGRDAVCAKVPGPCGIQRSGVGAESQYGCAQFAP